MHETASPKADAEAALLELMEATSLVSDCCTKGGAAYELDPCLARLVVFRAHRLQRSLSDLVLRLSGKMQAPATNGPAANAKGPSKVWKRWFCPGDGAVVLCEHKAWRRGAYGDWSEIPFPAGRATLALVREHVAKLPGRWQEVSEGFEGANGVRAVEGDEPG